MAQMTPVGNVQGRDLNEVIHKTNAKPITGQALAHFRGSKKRQALMGARLVIGSRALVSPTIPQAARLVGVSPAYVHLALAVIPDENLTALVEEEHLALVDAARRQHRLTVPKPTEQVIDAAVAVPTDAMIDTMIRAAGVARTWDRLSAAIS
jgi:hypothetical protein